MKLQWLIPQEAKKVSRGVVVKSMSLSRCKRRGGFELRRGAHSYEGSCSLLLAELTDRNIPTGGGQRHHAPRKYFRTFRRRVHARGVIVVVAFITLCEISPRTCNISNKVLHVYNATSITLALTLLLYGQPI
jgi:hypothetical protein